MTPQNAYTSRSRTARSLIAAGAAAIPLVLFGFGSPAQAHEGPVTVRLDPMPGSDASGTATLTPNHDGSLTVQITGMNMVPGQPHAQHIHGDTSGHDFTCPGPDQDTDGDGYLTVEEGLPLYGNIHISLTTEGDTTPASGLAVDRM